MIKHIALPCLLTLGIFASGCVASVPDVDESDEEVIAEAASALDCQFRVVWDTAGVYEKPSNMDLLKKKHRGDVVGGYCGVTYENVHEGHTYRAVATESAEDGVGWMRKGALDRL